jgi:hypothetical protein
MLKLDKSQITRNLGKKYKLIPYLEKALIGFEDEWSYKYTQKKLDTAWHPSGDCTPPVSELYEKVTGTYEGHDFSGLDKNFQVGHFWHQFLQYIILHKLEFCEPDAIERRGTKDWSNTNNCEPGHWVTGAGDIAPILLPCGWRGIVDIKSMSSFAFKKSENELPFADKYECQFNIYMDLFDEDRAMLLAVNKDTPHDFKEFIFERDQDMIDAIYAKWEYVGACLTAGEPPTTKDDKIFILPELKGPVST